MFVGSILQFINLIQRLSLLQEENNQKCRKVEGLKNFGMDCFYSIRKQISADLHQLKLMGLWISKNSKGKNFNDWEVTSQGTEKLLS